MIQTCCEEWMAYALVLWDATDVENVKTTNGGEFEEGWLRWKTV